MSIHRIFSINTSQYKRRFFFENYLCRRKGETVSTPLDKDGRSSDLYDNTRQGMAASTRHLARFFSSSFQVKSYFFTIFFALLQIGALVW